MKTIALIYTLACCGSLPAWAQAVHLSAGHTFSFGFNGTGVCRFTEFSPGSVVGDSFVSPTPDTSCEIAVAVPERMGALLMGIGAALGGLVFCLRRKISRSMRRT